ncbi:sigma-70 family RNA polymerase sigma factor [Sphingorhabdus arenilitoris]|uniref:Sigma-70 family RNA polymerase sigma factor n=1 Tax=Sphingorhabdus arenilitoris TaxID=1490041 RepID=A0ABV8RCD9_9SPHN
MTDTEQTYHAAHLVRETDEERLLWARHQNNGSVEAYHDLFKLYHPLAVKVAQRFWGNYYKSGVEFAEILQMANEGLLGCLHRYRPDMGVPFRYFCNRRIYGSILNGIEKHNELHEYLGYRARVKRDRITSLKKKMAGAATLEEQLQILADIASGLALGFMLEQFSPEKHDRPDASPSAYHSLAWKQAITSVFKEISALPDRERDIIELHYIQELSFRQIAAMYKISFGRVSQLHQSSLSLLRKRLQRKGQFKLEG